MSKLTTTDIKAIALELTKLDANEKYLHWMFNNDLMFWSVYDKKLIATRKRIGELEDTLRKGKLS